MKILIVAGTLGKGGAERQLFYLCRLLKQRSHEVKVLCFTKGEYYEHEIKKVGVEIEQITQSKNKFYKLFEIYKLTIKYKPDILYGFHFYTGIYVGLIGRILKIKSFGSIRSNGIAEKTANGFLSWVHFSLPHNIIANSKNAIENCNKIFYKKKTIYLPNIVDLKEFKFSTKVNHQPKKILFIGSLRNVKQPELFVELVRKINEKQTISAKVLGEGKLKEELAKQAENLPIEFLGNVDDVKPYIYEADILISTSKLEGTPNVFLESFACGTNVMALYHDGLYNWINYGLIDRYDSIEKMQFDIKTKKIDSERAIKNLEFVKKEHSFEKAWEIFESEVLCL